MKIAAAIVAALATAGIGLLVAWMLARREARLERHLAGYEPVGSARPMTAEEMSLAPESKIVSQAFDFTTALAKRTGVLARTEVLLETADVPVRPAEFLFWVPAVALAFGGVIAAGISPLTGLLVGVALFAAPFIYVYGKRKQRLHAFDEQLPDALNLLASSMRAGFSLMQGIEAVATEAREPAKRELHRVFTETRLGRSVDVALEDCATRMHNNDLMWVVLALRIQREVGGNLAELLVTVADTMTQRERLRREIKALTAEGRFSAIVLSVMPFFFLGAFQILAPDYVPHLFHNFTGTLALVCAGIANIVGWVWLRKMVNIEV